MPFFKLMTRLWCFYMLHYFIFSFCCFFYRGFKFLTFTIVLNFFKLDVNSAFRPLERAPYKCLLLWQYKRLDAQSK